MTGDTVTGTRPAPYESGDTRNGGQTRRPGGVTDTRPAPNGPGPRAVTCSACDGDVPPDVNMLVLARSWKVKDRRLPIGSPLCVPCATEASQQDFGGDIIPWRTYGARTADRSRVEYQHWCALCGRSFYGAIRRRYCSDDCCQQARSQRRDRRQDRRPQPCEVCGEPFTPSRSDGRYCSPAHRQKAYRARKAVS